MIRILKRRKCDGCKSKKRPVDNLCPHCSRFLCQKCQNSARHLAALYGVSQ